LLQKWLRNTFDVEDNAYKTSLFTYSRELDILISANFIIRSDVEEKSSPPYPKDVMMDLKEETMNSENTTLRVTP
jgi:hypothetical protein